MKWIALSLLLAAHASAQDAPDRARVEEANERITRAQELFEAGDFERALAEYARLGDLLEGHPQRALVIYNMGVCAERSFRYDEALAHYERYLAEPDAEGRYVETAREKLESLAQLLGTVRIEVAIDPIERRDPPAWEIFIDGHRIGERIDRARVPGGRLSIEVRADGWLADVEEILLRSGEERAVRLRLRAPRSPGLSPDAFWATTITAIGLAALALVLGPVALAEDARFAACARDVACRWAMGWHEADGTASIGGARDSVRAIGLAFDLTLGVAVAASIGAIVLGVSSDFGGGETAVSITPLGVALRRRW